MPEPGAGTVARPRLLWVTSEAPGKPIGGASRQAHLLEQLATRFEVTVLTAGSVSDPDVRAAATEMIEVPTPRPGLAGNELMRRFMTLANALVGRYPTDLRSRAQLRRVLGRRLVDLHGRFDAVLVVNPELAPILPRQTRAVTIVEYHHVLSVMLRHQADLATGRRRWLFERDARKAERMEQRQLTTYEIAVMCTDEDAALARAKGAREVIVVPNGVNLASFAPTPVPGAHRVVFPGTLDFLPNVDGALWFCRDIWPRVRAELPDAELAVVGRRPPPEVVALGAHPGVEVHADVPSMNPFLEQARVVVVPVRIGSGSRNKALEAMAAARPLVGTTVGLAGLGIVDERHALIADDPAATAAAIVRVLTDDVLAAKLSTAGRQLVEEKFGWEAISARFADDLVAAVDRARS